MDLNSSMLEKLPCFYKNVLLYVFDLLQYCNGSIPSNEFTWFSNNFTTDGDPVYWEEWYDKFIKYIGNLLDDNGQFLSIDAFNSKYELTSNFLSLFQIKDAIPLCWRNQLPNLHTVDQMWNSSMIKLNDVTGPTPSAKLSSRQFYWLFIRIDHNKANIRLAYINKWENLYQFEEQEWVSIFTSAFKMCQSTKFQSFQYRLFHRIVTWIHWLFNANVKYSLSCKYCSLDNTLQHFSYIVMM